MNIQVTHDGKTYNFENGSEAFIFDIGTCHEMRDNQLIAFVSLVHECYLFGEFEYVLGENQKCEFVTWRYTHGTYYFGHYITDYNKALIDLYTRVLAETQTILENIKE